MTSLWRAIRPTKEERVAKLEWAANGGLGRATIGKVSYSFHSRSHLEPPLFTQVSVVFRRWSRWLTLYDQTPELTYVREPLPSLASFSY